MYHRPYGVKLEQQGKSKQVCCFVTDIAEKTL